MQYEVQLDRETADALVRASLAVEVPTNMSAADIVTITLGVVSVGANLVTLVVGIDGVRELVRRALTKEGEVHELYVETDGVSVTVRGSDVEAISRALARLL